MEAAEATTKAGKEAAAATRKPEAAKKGKGKGPIQKPGGKADEPGGKAAKKVEVEKAKEAAEKAREAVIEAEEQHLAPHKVAGTYRSHTHSLACMHAHCTHAPVMTGRGHRAGENRQLGASYPLAPASPGQSTEVSKTCRACYYALIARALPSRIHVKAPP